MATSAPSFADFTDKAVKAQMLERLAAFAPDTFHPDKGVVYHAEPKNQISLPDGMTPAKGSLVLAEVAKGQEEEKVFRKTFRVRPKDGAHATQKVMQLMFGSTGRMVAIPGLFGSTPPQMIEIETDWEVTTQVPWGRTEFQFFDGWLQTGATPDPVYGLLFELAINAPKKYEAAIQGFFAAIEGYLKQHSIYKGKAIVGVEEPRFLKPGTDPTIVYNKSVLDALNTTVWGVLRNRAVLTSDRRKVNKRILIEGPFGTGKSEAGRQTAQLCRELGVTFIQFEGTRLDELEMAARTAQLYSGDEGAVLWIEDIDKLVSSDGTEDPTQLKHNQSRLLELFDGISSKDDGVMIVMTTNHTADMSKGMLRAGRVDRIIQISYLDEESTKQMIELVIGKERLAKDIDWNAVWKAMEGFEPAFVRTTFDQAAEAAVVRNADLLRARGMTDTQIMQEAPKFVLGTEDFIIAAGLLRGQHDLHAGKSEEKRVTFDMLLGEIVTRVITKHGVQGYDDVMRIVPVDASVED